MQRIQTGELLVRGERDREQRHFRNLLIVWMVSVTIGFIVLMLGVGLANDIASCNRQIAPRVAQREFLLSDAALADQRARSQLKLAQTEPASRSIYLARARQERTAAKRWRSIARGVSIPKCSTFPPPTD